MRENDHTFFSNRTCKFFPCHKGADSENFNCLFCYCPLYTLNEECGGDFKYTLSGKKDCSSCLIPHSDSAYTYITDRLCDKKGREHIEKVNCYGIS